MKIKKNTITGPISSSVEVSEDLLFSDIWTFSTSKFGDNCANSNYYHEQTAIGATGSFKKYHPIIAAKTVVISRNIAASPTLSSRVVSIIDPKLKIPTNLPIKPRSMRGTRGLQSGIRNYLQNITGGKPSPSTTENHTTKTILLSTWRMPKHHKPCISP